jgi:hypothetical protein
MAGGGHGGQRIVDIVHAQLRPSRLGPAFAPVVHLESTAIRENRPALPSRRAPNRSTGVQQPMVSTSARWASCRWRRSARNRARCAADDETGAGSPPDRENVGVVKFQIVQNQRARPVMDELGALVEKCRVVFIRFHHEEWRCAPSRADWPKLAGIPPIRKPGSNPAHSRIQASRLLVVVLPCVPATAITWRPRST